MAKRARYGSYTWTDSKTGYLYARVRVTLPNGKPKTIYKRALNITHAKELADEILSEYENRGQAFIDGRSMTLAQWAERYKDEFVVEEVYSDGVKVDGMRTWVAERHKIDRIVGELGPDLLISDINEELLRRHKRRRLKTVKISTVNRDLETLRAMMRQAKKKKLCKDDIDFSSLLDKSLETRRTVTVTDEQIEAVLAAAKGLVYSPRIYALILALYDGGARPSELYPVNDFKSNYNDGSKTKYYPLRWRDLFNETGEIVNITRVIATKGQRLEPRLMVVTNRMADAFRDLWVFLERSKNVTPEHSARLDNLVFPHRSFQTAWEIVRENAGLPGLRLRDLRRDWVTRLSKRGFSERLGQRAAGHKRMQQTFEYTEFDLEAAMQLKALLDNDVITTEGIQ